METGLNAYAWSVTKLFCAVRTVSLGTTLSTLTGFLFTRDFLKWKFPIFCAQAYLWSTCIKPCFPRVQLIYKWTLVHTGQGYPYCIRFFVGWRVNSASWGLSEKIYTMLFISTLPSICKQLQGSLSILKKCKSACNILMLTIINFKKCWANFVGK